MSVLVAEQDETIMNIETQAAAVEKDTEAGCVLLDRRFGFISADRAT